MTSKGMLPILPPASSGCLFFRMTSSGKRWRGPRCPSTKRVPRAARHWSMRSRPGTTRDIEDFDKFQKDPIARWVEGTFGVIPAPGSGRLQRSKPIPLTGRKGAAEHLSEITGAPADLCREVIAQTLLAGAISIRHPRTGFPVFPFRLHQFISRGDTIYSTVEEPEKRYLTIHGQLYFAERQRTKSFCPFVFAGNAVRNIIRSIGPGMRRPAWRSLFPAKRTTGPRFRGRNWVSFI